MLGFVVEVMLKKNKAWAVTGCLHHKFVGNVAFVYESNMTDLYEGEINLIVFFFKIGPSYTKIVTQYTLDILLGCISFVWNISVVNI